MANELESASFYTTVLRLKGRRGPSVTKYAIVTASMKLYQWTPGATGTDDSETDADCISPTGGTDGRWQTIAYIPTESAISAGMLRTTAHTEADWYIDATNGLDSNDGLTEDTALRTMAEFGDRIYANVIDGGSAVPVVTLHVLSDITDDIELRLRCIRGGKLSVADSRPVADRSIASYQITARTNWSNASHTEISFTCGAIPTTIAALPSTDGAGGVGYQAIVSAGTAGHVGASTWVVAETSARVAARCPGWCLAESFETLDVSVGDTVAFCRMRKMTGLLQVFVEGHGLAEFIDIELGTPGQAHGSNVVRGTAYFFRCLVHGMDIGNDHGAIGPAQVFYIGCRGHNGCRALDGSGVSVFASCFTRSVSSALNAYGSISVYDQNVVYGNPIVLLETGFLYVVSGGSVAICSSTVGVSAGQHSKTANYGTIWGRDVTSVFLNMYTFARFGTVAGGIAVVGTTPTVGIQKFSTGPSQSTLALPFNATGSTSAEVI